MIIKTKEDWWAQAEFILPALIDYSYEQQTFWDHVGAAEFFAEQNHYALYQMFERFWFDLPDNASIRYGVFFPLCDLCSEYWVFQNAG